MAKKKETPDTEETPEAAEDKVQAQSVEFTSAAEGGGAGATSSLDILLDMDVPVTVAVGQTELSIQKLLRLGPGTVIKLDKPISEPVDLYIKDAKFATGQVVVVEDKFAIKITDILGATADVAPETD
ncbi:MAG: FliM/FliN family flagellar motor switch protein [Planctomycetes bacterium]|nr:FliM/FliN family flagellar motor switch protein [Planctomycetota bacterium]